MVVGYNATYKTTPYEYNGRTYYYESGFDTVTPYDRSGGQTYPGYYSLYPLTVSKLYVTIWHALHLGWATTSHDESTLKAKFSRPNYGPISYDRQFYKATDLPSEIRVWCDQITETNISYCSNISAVIGMGFKWSSNESRSSKFDSSDSMTTNFVRCCYVLFSPTITRIQSISADRFAPVVFSASIDFEEVFASVLSYFGEPAPDPSVVFPDESSVPEKTTNPYSTLYGRHYLNNNIDLVWSRVLFRFDRDFHAKVIKENK